MIDVERVRADLPVLRHSAYLNSGTFGPLPEVVRRAVIDYMDGATEHGRIGKAGIETWIGSMESARAAVALAVSAAPEEMAITRATTEGVDLAIWGLDWEPGDEVITTDTEHPGITEPLEWLTRRRGVVVRTASISDGGDPAAAIEALYGPRTRMVAISHVLWTDGHVLPVERICASARAAGILTLLDGAQGAGLVPVDVHAIGCDFYTVSGQKWLCGPSGTGGLYVRPDAVEAISPAWPWYLTIDRHGPEAPRLWPGARRFDPGTLSIGALLGLCAAVEWRASHGFAAGHERSIALAARLRVLLDELDGVSAVAVPSPSGLVAIDVGTHDPDALSVALEEQRVLVRSVPGHPWIRASVGYWNDAGDLDRLVGALRTATQQ